MRFLSDRSNIFHLLIRLLLPLCKESIERNGQPYLTDSGTILSHPYGMTVA